jgi:hypothetical protein
MVDEAVTGAEHVKVSTRIILRCWNNRDYQIIWRLLGAHEWVNGSRSFSMWLIKERTHGCVRVGCGLWTVDGHHMSNPPQPVTLSVDAV